MSFYQLPARTIPPVRASLTMAITLVAVLEGILGHYGLGVSEGVLMALIGLVGVAIAGDTVRPSGMAKTVPGVVALSGTTVTGDADRPTNP